jgi:phenol/toluene 2-monooxygenase (NADH) P2/A2
MSSVFLILQTNEETRPIVDAIVIDNPKAVIDRQPAMIKIDAPERLVIRRETIEQQLSRAFDLQEIHINLVSLSGHVREDEDTLTLNWNR